MYNGDYYRNSEGYRSPTEGYVHAKIACEEKQKRYEARQKQLAEQFRRDVIMSRPRVYVVSQYAGDVKNNIRQARKYCRFVVKQRNIPFASHLLYPQFLNDSDAVEREMGLLYGLAMIKTCAEVWCFGTEHSAGMEMELKEAERLHKRIRYFTTEMEEII